MARRRIVLAIENASAMGRGVIQGVAEFAHGRETWCFASVTAASRFVLGQEVTPETADAVIGVIRPDIAERWPGEHRRRVVNVWGRRPRTAVHAIDPARRADLSISRSGGGRRRGDGPAPWRPP